MRRFKFHLIGPAPFGGTYHTADRHEVGRMVVEGWRIYRINQIPDKYWR